MCVDIGIDGRFRYTDMDSDVERRKLLVVHEVLDDARRNTKDFRYLLQGINRLNRASKREENGAEIAIREDNLDFRHGKAVNFRRIVSKRVFYVCRDCRRLHGVDVERKVDDRHIIGDDVLTDKRFGELRILFRAFGRVLTKAVQFYGEA